MRRDLANAVPAGSRGEKKASSAFRIVEARGPFAG